MSIPPAACAVALLERLNLRGVPRVYDIAERLGVGIEEREISSFDGALVRVKGSAAGMIAPFVGITLPTVAPIP